MFSLYFNKLNSYHDLGLKIIKRPNFFIAQKNINIYEVEGRNGSLIEDLETYKDIEITVSFNFIDRTNINQKIREIKSWLIGKIKDKQLMFSDDSDVFYKVKYMKIDNIERTLKYLGKFNVVFVCDPFTYSKAGENTVIITNNNSQIYNHGTYYSEPQLKIYGTGDITLSINNENIILKSIQDYIMIDTEMQEAYREGQSLNNKMHGEFLTLQVGENTISWLGNVTKLEIIPRWRFL